MKRIFYLFTGIAFILVSMIRCGEEPFEMDDSQTLQQEDGALLKGTKVKKKLDVCHYDEGTDSWKTMSIAPINLQTHLDHGDTAGACFKSNIPTVTSATGKIWMDRNLGANSVAKSSTDVDGFGDLYQWGRNNDGHQLRTSGTTETWSSVDQPGHNDFILQTWNADWRRPQNPNLWQGVAGVNNPCPSGFRIPTKDEWVEEVLSWDPLLNREAGGFASLKLTMNNYRDKNDGLIKEGFGGFYWSSTVNTVTKYPEGGIPYTKNNSFRLSFLNLGSPTPENPGYNLYALGNAFALACRCIQEY